MTDSIPTPRWFYPTPSWLILALLIVECLLWLSNRYQWPTWHKGYAVLTAVVAVGLAFVVMLHWFLVALALRRRFQFSIRSLLVLVIVVAVPFSWLAVEMKAAREQKEAVEAIMKVGGAVVYDWKLDAGGFFLPNAQPPVPAWLRKLLGDDFFGAVDRVAAPLDVTDEGLIQVARLTQLRHLDLTKTKVTDAGVKKFQQALPNCKIER